MVSSPESPPLIIAHRGDSRHAPENTLTAFRLAMKKGSDGVEFDVQLARDGVPVVIHDFNLKRTAGRPERVSELTTAELAAVDVGSWFNRKHTALARSEYSNERVSTLGDVLNTVASCSRIYVELKCDKYDDYARLAAAVAETLQGRESLKSIVVKSFKLATLPIIKSLVPGVTTAALFAPTIMLLLRRKEYIIDIAREADADEISLHTSLATKNLAQICRRKNIPVAVWTADDPKWVARARDRFVRALITNDPGTMLRARTELQSNPANREWLNR